MVASACCVAYFDPTCFIDLYIVFGGLLFTLLRLGHHLCLVTFHVFGRGKIILFL